MNCPNCNQPIPPGSSFCSGCGAQVAAPPEGGGGTKSGGAKVWIIIGCAIAAVIAIPVIGIVAAIAIPNLLSAIQRGKQKRTMGDLKTVASALEQYHTDNGHYPVARNMDEVCKALVPEYLPTCIYKDGWWSSQTPGRVFAYAAWGGEAKNCAPDSQAAGGGSAGDARGDRDPAGCGPRHFGLASAGKNGKWAVESFDQYPPESDTDSFDADIVIIDGQFAQAPIGKQRHTPLDERYTRPPVAPAPEPSAEPAPLPEPGGSPR